MKNLEELKKMNESFATLQKDFKTKFLSKADGEEKDEMAEKMCEMMDSINRRFQWMYEDMGSLYKALSEHKQGHLPQLTPGALAKLIKAAGLEDSYEVQKKQIYASSYNNGKNNILEVEFKEDKNKKV